MKRLLILGLLVCNSIVAQNLGETVSVYDNPCEALLLKEAARLRHDLASIRSNGGSMRRMLSTGKPWRRSSDCRPISSSLYQ